MAKNTTEWSLERRIGLGTLITLLGMLITGITLASSLELRVCDMEQAAQTLYGEQQKMRETVLQVARLDERIAAMQTMLVQIQQDVRALHGITRTADALHIRKAVHCE